MLIEYIPVESTRGRSIHWVALYLDESLRAARVGYFTEAHPDRITVFPPNWRMIPCTRE